jgi:hypothetical protein
LLDQFLAIALRHKFMARTLNGQEFSPRGHESQRVLNFRDGAESVSRSMNKQSRNLQRWKVFSAQLGRFLRRVKRIGEQEKALNQF